MWELNLANFADFLIGIFLFFFVSPKSLPKFFPKQHISFNWLTIILITNNIDIEHWIDSNTKEDDENGSWNWISEIFFFFVFKIYISNKKDTFVV